MAKRNMQDATRGDLKPIRARVRVLERGVRNLTKAMFKLSDRVSQLGGKR